MSGEEDQGVPATIAEQTPVTTAIVPVSTTPPYLSGIRGMPGMSPLQWSQFNMESTQKTYLLTQGPKRYSQFDTGLFQSLGGQIPRQSGAMGMTASRAWITEHLKERKDYLLPENDEEEDEVEHCLDTLERAKRKFNRDLEEVIQAIPDMVVQALQVEMAAQPAQDQGGQQPAPRDQPNQLRARSRPGGARP
ncbi:UNVERIFIED_CONTAM: hypothetical protein K2H54_049475 [Gekko kuhli]